MPFRPAARRATPLQRLLSPCAGPGCCASLCASPLAALLPGGGARQPLPFAASLFGVGGRWGATGAHAAAVDARAVLRAVEPTLDADARDEDKARQRGGAHAEGAGGDGGGGGERGDEVDAAAAAAAGGVEEGVSPWLWEPRWTDPPYVWAALMAGHALVGATAAGTGVGGFSQQPWALQAAFGWSLAGCALCQALVLLCDPGVITPQEEPDELAATFARETLHDDDKGYGYSHGGKRATAHEHDVPAEGGGSDGGIRPPKPPGMRNVRRDHAGDIVRAVRGAGGAIEVHKYCAVCNIWRPPHASHCSECNVCVLRMDHHCGAMGTCIGMGNQRFFVAFLGCGSVAYGTLFYAHLARLWQLGWTQRLRAFATAETYALPLTALISLIVALAMGLFFVAQAAALWSSVTTRQRNKAKGLTRATARPAWCPAWCPSWLALIAGAMFGTAADCAALAADFVCRARRRQRELQTSRANGGAVGGDGVGSTGNGSRSAEGGNCSGGEQVEDDLWAQRDADQLSGDEVASGFGIQSGIFGGFEAEHPMGAADCAALWLARPRPRPQLPMRRRKPPPGLGSAAANLGRWGHPRWDPYSADGKQVGELDESGYVTGGMLHGTHAPRKWDDCQWFNS